MMAINFFKETSFLHSRERWIWIDVYKMVRGCCPTELNASFFKEGNSSRTSLRLDHRKGECHELPAFRLIKMQLVQKRLDEPQNAQLLVLQFHFLHSESLCDLISHFISQKYILSLLDLEQLKCKGFPYGKGRQAHGKQALCLHFRDIRMGKQSWATLARRLLHQFECLRAINTFKSS